MSYNILNISQSGQSLFGNANTTSQYGDSDVAAKAISQSHFVCSHPSARGLSPASISLFAAGPKQSSTATDTGAADCLHSQSAPALDSAAPPTVPAATPPHQSCGYRGVATVARTTIHPWGELSQAIFFHAFYFTKRIAMPRKSWRRFTSCWCLQLQQRSRI